MNKKAWHYVNFVTFMNKLTGITLDANDFVDSGKVHFQQKFYRIVHQDLEEYIPLGLANNKFVKMRRGNEYYLVPFEFIDKIPIQPTQWTEVLLKKSESQVWRFVTECETFDIQGKKIWDWKETLERWNPMNHEDDMSWLFLKMLALGKGNKVGVCAEVAAGKNANITIMETLTGKYIKLTTCPTPAKLYKDIFYHNFICLDEITSWQKSKVSDIEDMMAVMGDDSPNMHKFSQRHGSELEIVSVHEKNLTFTFNPMSEANPTAFHEKFANGDKIMDRFALLLLKGKINEAITKPSSHESEQLVEEFWKDYQRHLVNALYWIDNIGKHTHGWNTDKLKLERRQKNNIQDLLRRIDVYCDSQMEFDVWLEWINKRNNDYYAMLKENKVWNIK